MVPSYRSPVKLEVARDGARDGTPTTVRGGLVVLFELLAAKRFLADLPQAGGNPAQGWSDGQMILAVLVLNIAGLDRVSNIDLQEADAGLCGMVRRTSSRRCSGCRSAPSQAHPGRARALLSLGPLDPGLAGLLSFRGRA